LVFLDSDLLIGSFFRSGFKLIDTSSNNLVLTSSLSNSQLSYGVDINPSDPTIAIGSGGSFFIKI
jgi:hypothetical protein